MVSSRFVNYVLTSLSLLLSVADAFPLEPRQNNFGCRSAVHPNPVVLVHGLFANQYNDLYSLDYYLQNLGFCTFSLIYGEYPYSQYPYVGGLKPIATSAQEIASFIKAVKVGTGASKVDLIGHSEGGFQVLYVPKFEASVASIVDKIISIAPPTRGTTLSGFYDFLLWNNQTHEYIKEVVDSVGCGACNDLLPDGSPVKQLNTGSIVQSGNKLTVIMSTKDRVVTPAVTTSTVNEAGVKNIVVQTQCPDDPVGHVGLAFDTYVWGLITNALDPRIPTRSCTVGQPY